MSSALLASRTKAIITCALAYVGVEFVHQGRHPQKGLDCIGLLVLAHQDAGYDVSDWTTYSRQPDPTTLFKHLALNFERVDREPAEGDCLLFNYRRRGPQHVGLFDGAGGLIHTWADIGRVVYNPHDERWLRRLHSVWHVKEELWRR